jgi:hypothetical protein
VSEKRPRRPVRLRWERQYIPDAQQQVDGETQGVFRRSPPRLREGRLEWDGFCPPSAYLLRSARWPARLLISSDCLCLRRLPRQAAHRRVEQGLLGTHPLLA